MDDHQEPVNRFMFPDIRATEEHERINGARFVRRRLYNGETLICETLTIADGFWLSKKLDLPKILTQLCDQMYSRRKNDSGIPSCGQFSDAIDLLDKLEQLGLKLQYPAEATDLGQSIREYQIEILKKGSEYLKILFPEAAERLREKESGTTL